MITIINYHMGNLGSITNMFKRIGYRSQITSDPVEIDAATKIILPGVGHFDRAMQNLHTLGLVEVIKRKALDENSPVLGICLGMQLMCRSSEEGRAKGLGLINAVVQRFTFSSNEAFKNTSYGMESS